MLLWPDRKRVGRKIEFPTPEPVFDTVQEARR
jgi:hypothetical protein